MRDVVDKTDVNTQKVILLVRDATVISRGHAAKIPVHVQTLYQGDVFEMYRLKERGECCVPGIALHLKEGRDAFKLMVNLSEQDLRVSRKYVFVRTGPCVQ